jgi:hypothetical protein
MKCRAILIDPEARSFTEVQISPDIIEEIYRMIGCRRFVSSGRSLNGSLEEGFDHILSDYNMEDRGDPRFWFQVDADRNPPSSFPIAGRGLVVGVDDSGGRCDAGISIDALKKRIAFSANSAASMSRRASHISPSDSRPRLSTAPMKKTATDMGVILERAMMYLDRDL